LSGCSAPTSPFTKSASAGEGVSASWTPPVLALLLSFASSHPFTSIAVAAICPHHLLPALGHASIVYLPGAMLLGIGTLTSLVDAFARRLTLQEAIGQNVVSALMEHAGARGAYCELSLSHSCLRARGERQTSSVVRSSARAGEFASPAAVPEIALALGRAPATSEYSAG